jgi:hypothetical protein
VERKRLQDNCAMLEKRQLEATQKNSLLLSQTEIERNRNEQLEIELSGYRELIRGWKMAPEDGTDHSGPVP